MKLTPCLDVMNKGIQTAVLNPFWNKIEFNKIKKNTTVQTKRDIILK